MNTNNFKAKLRKIGNSLGVYIPKDVITSYKIGDEIELNVITKQSNVITKPKVKKPDVYTEKFQEKTPFNTKWCKKHDVMKGTCGCI